MPEMLLKEETSQKIVLEMNPANRIRWIGAQEAEVIIDLVAQRVTRIEKYLFGRKTQRELRFEQVSRIVIHCEEVGHSCFLQLESKDKEPFVVNVLFPADQDRSLLTDLAQKLSRYLNKPIVQKMTDMGNLISEEVIQP